MLTAPPTTSRGVPCRPIKYMDGSTTRGSAEEPARIMNGIGEEKLSINNTHRVD